VILISQSSTPIGVSQIAPRRRYGMLALAGADSRYKASIVAADYKTKLHVLRHDHGPLTHPV